MEQERDYKLLLLRVLNYFNEYPMSEVRARTSDLAVVSGLGVWRVRAAMKYAEYILLNPFPSTLTREEVLGRLRELGVTANRTPPAASSAAPVNPSDASDVRTEEEPEPEQDKPGDSDEQ